LKKVLITGGTGFIGRHVIQDLLVKNYEVHAIHTSDFMFPARVISHKLDLLNSVAVNDFLQQHRFEQLIHLAWYVGNKCHVADINVVWLQASLNLIQQFIQNGGEKFLGAGSVSEYDYFYGYLHEDSTPLSSNTLYGQCKSSLYNVCKIYCQQNNVDFKWARIFNVYGSYERKERLMPYVINSMLQNEEVKVSNCIQFQDYLYVEDMAKALVCLFESKAQGAVNLCSGTPIKLRVIVENIAQIIGFKGKISWGAIEASFDHPMVVGCNSKLTDQVGWQQKISIEDGLLSTIKWWQDNKGKINV